MPPNFVSIVRLQYSLYCLPPIYNNKKKKIKFRKVGAYSETPPKQLLSLGIYSSYQVFIFLPLCF